MKIELEYSEALFQQAAKYAIRYKLRWLIRLLPLLALFCWGVAYFLVLSGWDTMMGYVYAVLPFLFLIVPMLWYFRMMNASRTLLKKLVNRTLTLELMEEGVEVNFELGHSKIHWKHFHALRCFDRLWLLMPNVMTYYPIPTELLNEEMKAFLIAQLDANQVPVCPHPKNK